jgi:5-(carboxyamino)imidazole ribonucleotide mutase
MRTIDRFWRFTIQYLINTWLQPHLLPVMLSEALQRNAKHEARLSNISGCDLSAVKKTQRFLDFAPNDRASWPFTENPYNLLMPESKPSVAIIMGSKSDWDTMRNAVETLDVLGVPNEARVLSAHRTPDATAEFARGAADRGVRVIIAGAGGAAHLAGVIAAHTWLPVLGVPIQSKLQGLDSLLSTAQMPGGIPVGTLAIGEAGAKNAALLAAAILATSDDTIRQKLEAFRRKQAETVLAAKLPR